MSAARYKKSFFQSWLLLAFAMMLVFAGALSAQNQQADDDSGAEESDQDNKDEQPADTEEKTGGDDQATEKKPDEEKVRDALPRDLSAYSIEQLKQANKQLRDERLTYDRRLAEIPGAQYEKERSALYRKKDQVEIELKRVKQELRGRKERDFEQKIMQIREKYAAEIEAIEAKKSEERIQTIESFERTLVQNPASKLAPDILFRLAALYLDKEHDQYLEQMFEYEKQVEKLMSEGADVVPLEPKKTYSKTIAIYRDIYRRFPKFMHLDGVLYNLAFCLSETGSLEEANSTFEKLIETKPDSNYVPEAYVRMGEYSFDLGQYEQAIAHYEQVLEFSESTFYDKALYKLGWSYYKLNDFENAKSFFTKVIDFSDVNTRTSLRSDDLRTEAVTYFAMCFADATEYEFSGGDQGVLAYFQEKGDREWKTDILASIGDIYFERAAYRGSREAYNTLLSISPNNPDNPETVKRIIESHEREQEYELAIAEGERLAKLFGVDSTWRKVNVDNLQAIELADELIQSALYASATFHHETAQKLDRSPVDQRKEYTRAVMSYRQFVEDYPKSKLSYKAQFNMAESLYFSRRYREAAEEYVALLDYPEEEFYKDAAFSLIKSYDNLLEEDGGFRKDKAPKNKIKLRNAAQGLADSCLLYVKLFPEQKRNPEFLFRAGEVYYYHGYFVEARAIFDRLVFDPRYQDLKPAELAANLTIESYKIEEDFVSLETYSKKVRKIETIVSTQEQKQQIDILIQDAAFVSAQKNQARGDYAAAVAEYLRAATEHPDLENAPKALHNAAVIYETNLNNIYKANEIYVEVARRYPKWDGSPKDIFHAATNYEKIVEIDKAMAVYEQFGILYPAAKEAPDALFNAGLLREKNKEYSKAIEIYKRHLQQYPNSRDAGDITFAIAKLYEEMNQDSNQQIWLNEYTKHYGEAANLTEAYCKLGLIMQERKMIKDANDYFAKSYAVFKKAHSLNPSIDGRWAAMAWFNYTELDYKKYLAIEFSLPQWRMAQQLDQKATSWKLLRERYQEIIAIGNFEWATASLYKIGMINKIFADALFNAPVPEGLTPEEEDIYIVSLEDKAFPIQNRAIEAFEANLNRAASFRYRNEWVDMTYEELKKFKPDLVEQKFELTTPDISDVLYDYPEMVQLSE